MAFSGEKWPFRSKEKLFSVSYCSVLYRNCHANMLLAFISRLFQSRNNMRIQMSLRRCKQIYSDIRPSQQSYIVDLSYQSIQTCIGYITFKIGTINRLCMFKINNSLLPISHLVWVKDFVPAPKCVLLCKSATGHAKSVIGCRLLGDLKRNYVQTSKRKRGKNKKKVGRLWNHISVSASRLSPRPDVSRTLWGWESARGRDNGNGFRTSITPQLAWSPHL